MTDQNTQRPYYYHRKTGQTSWTKPEAKEGDATAPAGATAADGTAAGGVAADSAAAAVGVDAGNAAEDSLADGIAAVSLSS
jgi:hypothetical protein